MKKSIIKVSSLFLAIIVLITSFSFSAFADTAEYQDISGIDTFLCYEEDKQIVTMGYYTYPQFTSVIDYEGTYFKCDRVFSYYTVPCEIVDFDKYGINSECNAYEINPYDSYSFVIGDCTFYNDDENTVNSEFITSKYAGYEMLGMEKPFMYDFIHIFRMIFSFWG